MFFGDPNPHLAKVKVKDEDIEVHLPTCAEDFALINSLNPFSGYS
jgi:hypothetical protein